LSRSLLFSLLVLTLFIVSSVDGKDGDFAIYTDIGLSSSIAPERFNDFWGMGPSFGIETAFKFRPQITIGFFFEYDNFNLLKNKILQDAGLADSNVVFTGSDARFLVYGFSARWYLRRVIKGSRPYFITGLAMVEIKKDNPAIKNGLYTEYLSNWAWSQHEELIFLGAGYDQYISDLIYIFGDIKMNIVYTEFETTQFVLFRIGLALY